VAQSAFEISGLSFFVRRVRFPKRCNRESLEDLRTEAARLEQRRFDPRDRKYNSARPWRRGT